jgi:hypothetical protein
MPATSKVIRGAMATFVLLCAFSTGIVALVMLGLAHRDSLYHFGLERFLHTLAHWSWEERDTVHQHRALQ